MEQQTQEQTHEISSPNADENHDKQLVLYNPGQINDDGNGVSVGKDIISFFELEPETECDPPLVLPAVGAFAVQCAVCYKWRFIPTKEKYQEIREHIMDQPFSCDIAREWRNDVSCDVDGDIEQDESRLWVIDKPSIAQPPPGWDRELRIRGEGGYNFADVYYTSPTGKKLRSAVDVHKYLMKHPEFVGQGVRLSQFSFKKPKPLQENYTRKKRTAPLNASSRELVQVKSLPWTSPDVVTPPVKNKAQPTSKDMFSSVSSENQAHRTHNEAHRFEINAPLPPPNGLYD